MPNIRQFLATLTDRRPGDLFARVQAAAHDAATSPYSRDQPTAAQLEANSYRTGRVDIQGLPVRIENPRGTRREKPGRWSNLMVNHYGDIAGTKGNDGDPVDVFIGPFPELTVVYVVNQVGRDGAFDEHKVCIGFQSEADARTAYLSAYAPGWDGLASITRATVTQLKWWLKFGDKSRPFTPDVLPYEGQTTMDKVLWNAQAEPVTKPLHALMYELRVEDAEAGLMLDAVSMAEQMTDPDIEAMPLLDAMVVEVGRLQPKMEALQRIMAAAGGTVKPTEVSISDPVRYRGVAQVMVVFSMDDGQTVSVWFHNPDTTPAKLMPLDELISWKWMLNKKDVTIVVAPEKGRDLNPREVARRMMRLVERNTEAFKKANARTAERAALLQSLDTEIAGLEGTLADLNRKIEVAKVEAEDRKAVKSDGKEVGESFEVGGVSFVAVQFDRPIRHWRPKLVETGAVFESGIFKGESRPKMIADIEYGFERAGSVSEWRRRLGLPVASVEELEQREAESRAKLKEQFKKESAFDDFLAAVVFSISEKSGINAADAAKLAQTSVRRVNDGFADKMEAGEVADQILADNKRSPNVERAYRIAERLIAFYGWSKSAENDYPEQGINLDAPRDSGRWVFLGEEGGRLVSESKGLNFAFDTELSTDAELAANIDRADFEADLDTGVDGLVGDGNEFEGKTAAFAYAAEVLRKGSVAAGATVQFGDFNGSTSASMFDKATNPTPYADVSVYGITAQVGVGGRVLARASIDEEGKITILKGAGGTEEVGTPADAGDVRELVKQLMAEEAAKPAVVPDPAQVVEPATEPVPAVVAGAGFTGTRAEWDGLLIRAVEELGDMTTSDAQGVVDARTFLVAELWDKKAMPEAAADAILNESKVSIVDAAYKFDDASDEFKRWVADSIAEADYSPFASSKAIDEAAKKHGSRVSWDIKRVMDSISGEESPGAAGLLDSATGKKIVIDDQVPMKDRPFGVKQVAFVSWGTGNGAMLVDIDREARAEFGGGTFMAPAGELPGGPRLVRLDPKAMTMQVAQSGDGAMDWTEPVKLNGIKVYNLAKFTGAFRVAALDSVEPGDVVLDAAEGWDGIVGTIKNGAKIVGRAHVGGDGKAMVFVGKSGSTRVQYRSKRDGEVREHIWSEDDAGRLVDSLFNEPANGIAKAQEETQPAAPSDNDMTRLEALRKLAPEEREAIRSDDPKIIEKLQAKLNYLVANGEMMRKANKLVRKEDRAGLAAMGFTGRTLEALFQKDFAGRIGFADYQMTNNNGVIRTTRLRLEELMSQQAQEAATVAEEVAATTEEQAAATVPAVAANPDAEFLQSMIDGSINLLDPELVSKLEPLFEQYASDATMMDLLNRAANAYSDAAVAAAKKALGV